MSRTGELRRWLCGRRRPWTGLILAGAGAVALLLIALYGRSASSSALSLSGETAWLASTTPGIVSDISGSAAAPDARVGISGIKGHDVSVVQDGSMVVVVDHDTGTARLINPAQLTAGKPFSLGLAGSEILNDGEEIYSVDHADGAITYFRSLPSTASARLSLDTELGDAAVSSAGTLWVAEPGRGALRPIRNGRAGLPLRVAPPHQSLVMTTAGNSPVVVDTSTGMLVSVSPAGHLVSRRLPVPARALAGLLPSAPGPGPWAAFIAPALGKLILAEPRSGATFTIGLARGQAPVPQFGRPLVSRGRVYLTDGAGRLLVYGVTSRRLLRTVQVSASPSTLDIFPQGGLIWVNDPAGPQAAVIDGNAVWKIRKYQSGKRAGARPRPGTRHSVQPSPSPAGQSPGTGRPGPGGSLSITVSPAANAAVGQSLRFGVAGLSRGHVSAVRWTFGDGSSAAGVTVSHQWDRTGLFQVTVSVTWSTGAPATASVTVDVGNSPPARRLRCGMFLKKSVTLANNLSCKGDAIIIAANGVTLNLAGHTVTGGYGIYCGGDLLGPGFTNINIEDGTVGGGIDILNSHAVHMANVTVRGGAAFSGSHGVEMVGSSISGGVDVGQSGVTFSAMRFINSAITVDGPRDDAVFEDSILDSSKVSLVQAVSVSMVGDHLFQSQIFAGGSGNLLIKDDTIAGVSGAGVDVEGDFPALVVTGSTFTGNHIGLWIEDEQFSTSVPGASVTGNTFTGNGAAGLLLDLPSQRAAQGSVISGNRFYSNGHSANGTTDTSGHPVDNGLHVNLPASAPTVTVAGNQALGSAGYGIYAVPGSVKDGGGNTSSTKCVGVSCP